jgi:DNA-binding IclR family transcriptional regulator
MEYSCSELKKKTAAQLKEIAAGINHDAVRGYSTMHKEQLVEAICIALGIDLQEHHVAVGINKKKIKSEIKALKVEREKAIEAQNNEELKKIRKKIKLLKNKLRRAVV